MSYVYNGKTYKSKKFPVLEHIFFEKTKNASIHIGETITFTLQDVSRGYQACNIEKPASISNTILDLTRKKRPIAHRLPESIIAYGYDLKKKTGFSPDGNYCGEFVFVGVGNQIDSWLTWDEAKFKKVKIKNSIPEIVQTHLANDEGALFSAIDYCDLLSKAFGEAPHTVLRIQNPMKWQPNEIDGLYVNTRTNILYPIEAKAVSTGDNINLEQMYGQYITITRKRNGEKVIPVAAVMKPFGVDLAMLKEKNGALVPYKFIRATIDPPIDHWKKKK